MKSTGDQYGKYSKPIGPDRNQQLDGEYPAIARVKSGAHEAIDSIANSAIYAAEQIEVKAGQLKEYQAGLMENCGKYTRKHPIKSLSIAAIGGFVLSRFFR